MAAATLNDDVIAEIIARLPIKHAIQCLVLNKNFIRLISQRKNDAYKNIKGSIFCGDRHRISPESSEISTNSVHHSVTVLDSCNGLLLLRFNSRPFYVFNPITGGFMPVDPISEDVNVCLALAVDLNTTNYFKFVAVENLDSINDKLLLRFRVYDSGSRLIKSPVDLVCEVSHPSDWSRSVYVNGCLYWMDESSIIEFHVEMGKARVMDCGMFLESEDGVFLGSDDDGLLQVIYAVADEIVFHSYDHVTDEWHLKRKITNILPESVNPFRVLFFNGRHLLILDGYGVVFMHDILGSKWEIVTGEDFRVGPFGYSPKMYFSFVPTLAKVDSARIYKLSSRPAIKKSLQGLQRLITQGGTDTCRLLEYETERDRRKLYKPLMRSISF